MPKTKFGKWSVGCLGLFFVLLLLARVIVASGQAGGETFFSNPLISVPMSLAGIAGVLAFVFGVYSIIKQKERSVLVFVTTLIGLLILGFAAGELFGPAH
jgi:hypothetical protein